ncbi:XdhC family protein, partial [Salmonella sp. M275]|uniref:XdhC family protein n=1 Tax=Salmonella sp. M275 TaxID=3240302 RepID=UPI00352AB57F
IADIRAGRPVAVATVIDAPEGQRGRRLVVRPDGAEEAGGVPVVQGNLGSQRLADAVRDDARGLLAQGRTAVLRYGTDGE